MIAVERLMEVAAAVREDPVDGVEWHVEVALVRIEWMHGMEARCVKESLESY